MNKYKHGDVIELTNLSGEKVTIVADESCPKVPVTFEQLAALFKDGGTWDDAIELFGRPAKTCKAHDRVWCYECGDGK